MRDWFALRGQGRGALLAAGLAASGWASALDLTALDPFSTEAAVPGTSAKNFVYSTAAGSGCDLTLPAEPLTLLVGAQHALCNNPKTREAWADVKLKAAQVGSASSAYLPTVDATVKSSIDRSTSSVSDPTLSSQQHLSYQEYALGLTWKLLDFGSRKAQVSYAEQALIASQAGQDDALQSVFATTVKDYYTAVAAQAALESSRSTEDDAKHSLDAAKARYRGGVAAIVDQMQAQTDYAQAVFDRARAAGDAKASQGVLAVDMGLAPDTPLSLPALEEGTDDTTELGRPIGELIREARLSHPKSVQARALLQAALAKVDDARAQGLPTLSLSVRANNNNQPVIPAVGLAALPANGRDRFVGVQIDIPLFSGFARTYDIRAAKATAESQEINVHDVEQQVALNVWSSYSALETDVENVRNTQVLLNSAKESYVAAQQRYQKGVGSILELLSAQSAFGHARQRRLQSLSDWRTARLQLAASLGRLSLLALR